MPWHRVLLVARTHTRIWRIQELIHEEPWRFKLGWHYSFAGVSSLVSSTHTPIDVLFCLQLAICLYVYSVVCLSVIINQQLELSSVCYVHCSGSLLKVCN